MDTPKKDIMSEWQERVVRSRVRKQAKQFTAEETETRKQTAQRDYNYFVRTYFPDIARCECASFHLDAANYILHHHYARAVYEWARGHAKSTHMDVFIPMWLMIQPRREFETMVLVGKSLDAAKLLLADLQEQLEFNELYIHDFGEQIGGGSWADGEFETQDGRYFIALGRGQSPRGLKNKGHRPDYIVIDDLDDDEMSRNPDRVKRVTRWVLSALFGTMEAGRGRFVMVGNRIAASSVLTDLIARPNFYHTKVNILTDDGKPSWPQNYKSEEIQEMRQTMGERNFQQEYMNNPITEGSIFQEKHIKFGKMLANLKDYKQLVCYTDPSFKNSATADYKATMLVGVTPQGYFHVLKAYADQTSVTTMVGWHYQIMDYIAGKVPTMYYIEANFMQDLLLDEFKKTGNATGHHVPIVGDKRQKGDKFARIEAMSPLFERGLVVLNEDEKDSLGMKNLIEQLLMFERGSKAHDDAPDALESAIWMLSQRQRITTNQYRVISRPTRQY